jgi:Spy/CpxP family protein refolding chaperone
MRTIFSFTLATLLAVGSLQASTATQETAPQPPVHDMSRHRATMQQASPYAGEEERAIKAISDTERQELLGGHGMGLAKAAELNHYPGPRHVLELAVDLELSDEQVGATQAVFETMHEQAVDLGERILEREAQLDDLFGEARADEENLAEVIEAIGRLRAELRLAHLRAHLAMRVLLSPEQIAAYDRLRGYSSLDSGGR